MPFREMFFVVEEKNIEFRNAVHIDIRKTSSFSSREIFKYARWWARLVI